jgi:RHS repeat-associated protein
MHLMDKFLTADKHMILKNKIIKIISEVFLLLLTFSVLLPSEAYASETLRFIHQDHLGSTSVITDEAGNVVARQTYYPYGTERSSEGNISTERQYTGQMSDVDQTGLYYYNARYYNPTIAKFTQPDSTGDTLNKYSYVGNNPIIFTDPSGNKKGLPNDPTWLVPPQETQNTKNCSAGTWGGVTCAAEDFWQATINSFKSIPNYMHAVAQAWTADPEAFTTELAKGALYLVGYGATASINPELAEMADTSICAMTSDPGMCAITASPPGPNMSYFADDIASLSDDVTRQTRKAGVLVDNAPEYMADLARANLKGTIDEGNPTQLLQNVNYITETLVPYNKNLAPLADEVRTYEQLLCVGGGVCRHQADLTSAVAHELGFESYYYRWDVNPAADVPGHAVGLVRMNQQSWILDPSVDAALPWSVYMDDYFPDQIFNPKLHKIR